MQLEEVHVVVHYDVALLEQMGLGQTCGLQLAGDRQQDMAGSNEDQVFITEGGHAVSLNRNRSTRAIYGRTPGRSGRSQPAAPRLLYKLGVASFILRMTVTKAFSKQ